MKQRRRFPHLDHVGVGHLLNELHTFRGGFCGLNGAVGKQPPQLMQILQRLRHPQADQRIATAEVVVKEGQRRTHGEAVQPQRHFSQLDGQRILIDSVNAPLEHHAADDGLVGKLGLVQDPVRFFGPLKDLPANRRHTFHEGRNIVAIKPLRDRRKRTRSTRRCSPTRSPQQ